MNKEQFLSELRNALAGLPQEDVEERVAFYGEMIDDRMEEGLSEAEAVNGLGPVDEIVSQTLAGIPISRLVKEEMSKKGSLKAWEIVLLVLGFPLWFPLLIAAAAIVFSLYITLWSLVLALWAIELALWVGVGVLLAAAVLNFVKGRPFAGLALLGASRLSAGLSIFLVFGCVAASKGMVKLAEKVLLWIKSRFIRKENGK